MPRVLLLGGTREASELAQALAAARIDAIFSYAGRTADPLPQPLPTRIGGFGGVAGLCAFIRSEGITHVIDATHPFAVQMSLHAIEACAATGTPVLALERPPWQPEPGDRWVRVPDMASAAAALPREPQRIFLAIGRQHVQSFLQHAPQHWWLLRVVDGGLALSPAQGHVVVERGPFTVAGDLALLQRHRIEWIVAKNAGGSGGRAKLDAARHLGCPVILIERPPMPPRATVHTVDDALQWLRQDARK
ncbi:cobalt-precorrin-6A reductase [Tepidimonas taiwanensis]|uniref:Precorrin-6A reductase n=1 Tax=Tepidimonas taiwanensis TaxID=307486 RepID=A0A554XD98_9BURK|nr:cobalt-precorrin-6A reductase [Tepidimonas taiwanensis]MDM7463714.1 cobalt-precorrin-6A reductase [Tepidimonas taiwanensis]TSE33815.1 Precorrin-6A reductase [Tepidimonas taiwanensis]UBQ06649.1 cobalt-precorrin-6A reductase [Tepidimonas taiwanensis]